jgi:uncharacterized protein
VKSTHEHYLSHRVLKINVGFLLSDGPGNSQDSRLDIPSAVRVAEDLIINTMAGPLRLTRTKEGILVQAQLRIGITAECSRCLEAFNRTVEVAVEELYMHPAPVATEFFVGADAILDLAPLLRAEVLIEASQRALCRPDCKGICPECGSNRNHESCACDTTRIDPRLRGLRQLLDSSSADA